MENLLSLSWHDNLELTQRSRPVLFETIKLFDLALAPQEIQEADDFQYLKPRSTHAVEAPLLWVCVGGHVLSALGRDIYEAPPSAVSFSEYLLHKWLAAQGAGRGETVILTWSLKPSPIAGSQRSLVYAEAGDRHAMR
jgi:hypothetical protein